MSAHFEDMLKDWLLGREADIANSIEDFGGLRLVFAHYVGREPRDRFGQPHYGHDGDGLKEKDMML